MVEALTRIQHGWHHDPFEWLGIHPGRPGYVVRAFMPSAESVELDGIGAMSRREDSDTFEISISKAQKENLATHYSLCWIEKGSLDSHKVISPYSFQPVLSDFDLDLFSAGNHLHVYRFLGARLQTIDDIEALMAA